MGGGGKNIPQLMGYDEWRIRKSHKILAIARYTAPAQDPAELKEEVTIEMMRKGEESREIRRRDKVKQSEVRK